MSFYSLLYIYWVFYSKKKNSIFQRRKRKRKVAETETETGAVATEGEGEEEEPKVTSVSENEWPDNEKKQWPS